MNQEHTTIEELIDYLHGELEPERDAAILMHLQHCQTCSTAYDGQARLTESIRAYARASERELPQGVVNRIWDQIESERRQPSWTQRIAALWRPAIAVPAAAVIVVAAFFGYSSLHVAAPMTTIDASYYLQDHAALTNTVPFNEGTVVPPGLQPDENMTADVQSVHTGSFVAVLR